MADNLSRLENILDDPQPINDSFPDEQLAAIGLFGSRPSIATLCHTFLPSLPKVSSSK